MIHATANAVCLAMPATTRDAWAAALMLTAVALAGMGLFGLGWFVGRSR